MPSAPSSLPECATQQRPAQQNSMGHRWPRPLSAGTHVVTISSWGRDGFKAVAVRFKVER